MQLSAPWPWSETCLFQKLVDDLEVLGREQPGHAFQLQVTQDVGVTRDRVVTLGLVISLLGDQHVNDGARADLESGLGGFQRALR